MTGGRPWTPLDDQRLRKLAEAGTPYTEIGEILGRTQQAVQNRCYTIKIRFRAEQPKRTARKLLPEDAFTLDGEPIQFAETDDPCARCAVKELAHQQHGCGQFANNIRVRLR